MNITYTNHFKKGFLKEKIENLIDIVSLNPYKNPPPYEKLSGYNNRYSRRINEKHRLVYEVYKDTVIFIACSF